MPFNVPYIHPMLYSILEVCHPFPIGVGYDLVENHGGRFFRIEAQMIYMSQHMRSSYLSHCQLVKAQVILHRIARTIAARKHKVWM